MISLRYQAHGLGGWETEHTKNQNLCDTVKKDG
jgi:hypothetical protein